MKRVLIAGFLSLVSSLWAITLLAYTNGNLVTSWDGSRLWASVKACGAAAPLLIALILLAGSLVYLIAAFFKKD